MGSIVGQSSLSASVYCVVHNTAEVQTLRRQARGQVCLRLIGGRCLYSESHSVIFLLERGTDEARTALDVDVLALAPILILILILILIIEKTRHEARLGQQQVRHGQP